MALGDRQGCKRLRIKARPGEQLLRRGGLDGDVLQVGARTEYVLADLRHCAQDPERLGEVLADCRDGLGQRRLPHWVGDDVLGAQGPLEVVQVHEDLAALPALCRCQDPSRSHGLEGHVQAGGR